MNIVDKELLNHPIYAKGFGYGILLGITMTFISGLISFMIVDSDSIKPIDVYRGKTILEITYQDSVAIDSTVVYKKFDYGK